MKSSTTLLSLSIIAGLLFASVQLQSHNATASAQSKPPRPNSQNEIKIGFVKNRGEFDGCGCSLWLATDRKQSESRLVFVDDLGEAALMNIDGKDIKLAHTKHYERQAISKVGDRSWWEYQKGNTKVRLDFVATKVCDPKDESCEVTYYNAQITVTRGAQKQIIKTKGLCGC